MKKAIVTFVFLISFSAITFAQDINGKWAGKVMDQFDVSYTFKAEGEVLTGTTNDMQGNEIQIKNGKINGSDIEFILPIMDQETKVTGKLEGNTLKLKFNIMGNDMELVLKK